MKNIKKYLSNIMAFVMSLIILVTPFINFRKNIKGEKSKFKDSSSMVSNSDEANNLGRDFVLKVDGFQSIYNFDYSGLIIPTYYESYRSCSNTSHNYNDIYELMDKVKDNTISYLESRPEFINGFLDDINSDYHIDQILVQTILRDVIKDILVSGTNKDICLIEDLRVVISYDKNLVLKDILVKYFSDDNLLVVFPDNVRAIVDNKGLSQFNELKSAIMNEVNNIRLLSCKCHNDKEIFPYKSIREAAVTSELYNLEKTDRLFVDNKIMDERLILMLGLFHDDTSINDYYKAVFGNDLKGFYSFCGINNSDDTYKLNTILYTMDILNSNNNNSSSSIGYDYRADIMSMVIKNMINYTLAHEDFRLEDNLIVFSIIRDFIISDISTFNLEDDCFNNIIGLSDLYFDFLSNHYMVSLEKIRELEESKDIIIKAIAVIDICNKTNDYDGLDYDYVKKLNYSNKIIKRFPLLKYIFSNSDFNLSDYKLFLDSKNNDTNNKNRVLVKEK